MDSNMSAFILIYVFPISYILFKILKFLDDKRGRECYILDYECFKPSDDRMLTTDFSGDVIIRNKNLGLPEYKFLLRAIVSSGIGEQTYGPKMVFDGRETSPTLEHTVSEMDEFFDDSIHKLLSRSGVSPSEIDVLVVNISMLTSLPSMSARIINRYKMRSDIKVYNLTGMGCSASLVSVNVIQSIFKTQKDRYALLVSSESLSPNWYTGNDRSMILANCLFRVGGSAVLMTNKSSLKHKAKLKLKSLARTHHGSKDESYNCCLQKEDEGGRRGFYLSKSLPKVATKAFVDNFKDIAIKILPISELLRFSVAMFIWKWFKNSSSSNNNSNNNNNNNNVKLGGGSRPILNMKRGVDHFCLHTGGKAVIDGIGQSLNLSEYDLEPARMTLHRFGNTSASSLWYVLSYMEGKKRMKKGDKVFMISFGAGFKCNSCLWEVVNDLDDRNVWDDCIDTYPVKNLANPFFDKYGWINEEDDPDNIKFRD